MSEESKSRPKTKIPLFLVVVLILLGLIIIIACIYFIFLGGAETSFTGNVIALDKSNSSTTSSLCLTYAEQFGVTNASDCLDKDKPNCLAFYTAHFECCHS